VNPQGSLPSADAALALLIFSLVASTQI